MTSIQKLSVLEHSPVRVDWWRSQVSSHEHASLLMHKYIRPTSVRGNIPVIALTPKGLKRLRRGSK
jgi:hypothetical protein